MTRRSMIALPFAAAAFGNRWDEARFPEWDQKFVDRLLTDSPWARQWKGTILHQPEPKRLISSNWAQIGIGLPPLPGGGGGPRWPRDPRRGGTRPAAEPDPGPLRIGVELIVRWASALPVRRALALQEFGRTGLDRERVRALISEEPRDIVLHLAGIPSLVRGPELERELHKTRLSLPGKRPLGPSLVELPEPGAYVTATMRFPRVDHLTPDAGSARLVIPGGSFKMDEEFKLSRMVYEGRLEL